MSDLDRPPLIELAGLPGSGKTSITARLATPDGGLRRMVMKPSLDPLFRQPWVTLRAMRWGLMRPSLAWAAWAKLCLLRELFDAYPVVPGTTLLIEEGVAHHAWRTLFRYPPARACPWEKLVRTGPPLIVLRASRETRHGRLPGKRVAGDTNRRLAAGQPDEATWGTAERLFEAVLSAAAPRRTLVEVSTEGDLEGAVQRVRAAVASLG
ncbi:MAG TPA: hypothetical protein VF862_10735 [Gemmatimonadales bacterium]